MNSPAAALLMRETILELLRQSVGRRKPALHNVDPHAIARVAVQMECGGAHIVRFEGDAQSLQHLGRLAISAIRHETDNVAWPEDAASADAPPAGPARWKPHPL